MRIEKIIKSISAVLLALALSACGGGTDETGNATDTADTAGIAEVQTSSVQITEGDKPLYTIVRAEEAGTDIVDLAIELRRGLEEITGIDFKLETDWVKKGQEPDNQSYEIIVGTTNRAASQKLAAETNGLQYGVAVEGNKIMIFGRNSMSLADAVELFLKTGMVTLNDNGDYVIEGVPLMETMTLGENEVPPFHVGDIEIYKTHEDVQMMKVLGTTAESYKEYLEMLEACGFEKYTDNKINENLFATYISDTLTVNAYYIDTNKITRVVWEPRGTLPQLTIAEDYEATVDPLLISVDLEHIMFWEGMSYIVRLSDGRFILFDGGVSDPDGIECKKHLDLLKEHNPNGGKPVIAAWFFTHCHGDHLGLFPDFAVRYHDEVEIQSFVYNYPPEEEIAKSDSPYMVDDSNFRYTAFKKSIAEYYPDTPYIRPHTGNVFYIGDAKFEILNTHEDLYPYNVTTHGMNMSTVLYRMEIGGQTTMWLGDAAEITGDMAIEQFGDYLKSDIMQLAHHGGVGGTVRLYERIDPMLGLLPLEGEIFSASYEPTHWMCYDSENVQMVIVSGYGTTYFKLPFWPEEGKYNRLAPHTRRQGMNPPFFE